MGILAYFAIVILRYAIDSLGSGSEDDGPDHPEIERKRKKGDGAPVASADERE